MMIELNLLPEELKVAHRKGLVPRIKIKIPRIPMIPLVISIVAIFILNHLGISLLLTAQKTRLVKMSDRLTTLTPKEKESEGLKQELSSLNKKFLLMDSLTAESLIWSKKLYDLSEAMIDGIWLTSLNLATETQPQAQVQQAGYAAGPISAEPVQTLVLEGCAVSTTPSEETALVGKFINSLKNHKGFFSDFEDIKLSSIQSRPMGKTEVMDFTIICYFKPGRSYFEKLEGADI